MKNYNLTKIAFIAIVVVLIVIRLWGISYNPPSLNWDEASHGINAKSVLTTGKDEWGVSFPSIFRAFGDYKLPLYIYLTVPIVGIMGLSEFSVRFVSIMSGLVTVWFLYLIAKKEYKDNISYVVLLTALSLPWHVFLSRIALEANLSLALITSALYGLFYTSRKRYWNIAIALLGLSLHTYNSARVFTPLVFVFVLSWLIYKNRVKAIAPGLIVFSLCFVLMLQQIMTGVGLSRYEKLNILSENNVYAIGQMRLNSKLPAIISRLVYNRPTYLVTRVVFNYRSYLSVGFLTQSDRPQAQFAIPGQNLLLWTNTFLMLLGIAFLLRYKTRKLMIMLFFALLAVLPAALTESPPQALRPLYLIPLTIILIGYGYKSLSQIGKGHWVTISVLVVAMMLLEFGAFEWKYWNVYQAKYSSAWQYGYKQMVQKAISRQNEYDRVIVTKYYGEPHAFFGFWGAFPVTDLIPSEQNVRFNQSDWYWTDRVGKYYFVNDWDINKEKEVVHTESGLSVPLKRSLLITRAENMFEGSKEIDKVYDLEGKVVFVIASYE